jgi:hypothetical protein
MARAPAGAVSEGAVKRLAAQTLNSAVFALAALIWWLGDPVMACLLPCGWCLGRALAAFEDERFGDMRDLLDRWSKR